MAAEVVGEVIVGLIVVDPIAIAQIAKLVNAAGRYLDHRLPAALRVLFHGQSSRVPAVEIADHIDAIGPEVFWQDETYGAPLWGGSYEIDGGAYPYIFDNIVLSDRTVVNARLGIENVELSSGTLRASLWGRNLTDEEYNTYGINFASLGPITAQFGEPLTWGLDLTWEF